MFLTIINNYHYFKQRVFTTLHVKKIMFFGLNHLNFYLNVYLLNCYNFLISLFVTNC